jgi:hypothetical protein
MDLLAVLQLKRSCSAVASVSPRPLSPAAPSPSLAQSPEPLCTPTYPPAPLQVISCGGKLVLLEVIADPEMCIKNGTWSTIEDDLQRALCSSQEETAEWYRDLLVSPSDRLEASASGRGSRRATQGDLGSGERGGCETMAGDVRMDNCDETEARVKDWFDGTPGGDEDWKQRVMVR